MMIVFKKILLLVLIVTSCISPFVLHAQSLQKQQLTDSLLQALSKAKDDTSKIKTYCALVNAYATNDSKTALKYANQSMNLSRQRKWQKGIGLSYLAFSKISYELSDYTSLIQNAKKAYDIFETLDDKKNTGIALTYIANAYESCGFYTKSIENNLAALKLYESIDFKHGIGVAYNNIGVNYYYLLQYEKAIENYKKSLEIDTNEGNKFGIGSGLDNIALVYLDEGKYDSANVYDLQAIKFFEAVNHQPGLGRIYANRGDILMKLLDAKSAYEFYNRSLVINKKMGITDGISSDFSSIGAMYLELAKDSAKKYIVSTDMNVSKQELLKRSEGFLIKALASSKEAEDISLQMNQYNILSETEERLGNYKAALAYHKDYTLYKDSIFNDENKKKLAAMEIERLGEVKDQQIKLLNQQKALETSEIKRQTLIKNIILIAVFVVALFTSAVIFLYNRRKKIKFDKQVKEVEMKALRAQMNPHFIFNSLHSINRYVIENDKENASSYLSKFANLMRLILENSREQEVSLEKDLHALELYMQLESLRFKNRFTYSIETDSEINAENTLIPPLLLQPFVENAILHGVQGNENGFIKISVHKKNEMICCIIEDNGHSIEKSIVPHDNRKHKSLGKKIITERLNIINQIKKVKASVNIFDLKDAENKPSGLRVELFLPLELAF